MAVPMQDVQPGRVFEFSAGPRRVVSVADPVRTGFWVNWEYADGRKRGDRIGGSQWVHNFRKEAIGTIPDEWRRAEHTSDSGRVVKESNQLVNMD